MYTLWECAAHCHLQKKWCSSHGRISLHSACYCCQVIDYEITAQPRMSLVVNVNVNWLVGYQNNGRLLSVFEKCVYEISRGSIVKLMANML